MSLPNPTRRDFLRLAAIGAAVVTHPRLAGQPARGNLPVPGDRVAGLAPPRLEVVRWGLIGTGNRGLGQLRNLLRVDGCEIRALCDVDEAAVARATAALQDQNRPAAEVFKDGSEAFRRLVARDDIDAVMICTPWQWHVPMAVAAMEAGKHAFVEVPAAVTLDECWQLVDTSERTRRHCMMLENVCYGREELMVLNMCRQGLFGELLHGEGSYLHDLRKNMDHPDRGEGRWRFREEMVRNGNLYPTHGLGPIAQYMGINRGDRFSHLVSMSSPARGLAEYAQRLADDNPLKHQRYICGDMNTSIVQTALGRTILVQHDTSNGRPYSRHNLIQGTKGIFAGYPNRIAVEGRGKGTHDWDLDLGKWYAEFEHPLWTKLKEITAGPVKSDRLGHGGMDFLMVWRLVWCLRQGLPLDQDVYDAAAWSAIAPASEASVAQGGEPVEIPDFTRGAWKFTPPLPVVS